MINNIECGKCNKSNPSDAKFCTYCGELISNPKRIASRRKTIYSVLSAVITLVLILGYYQLYPKWQHQKYIEAVKPLYITLDTLINEQKNILKKGEHPLDDIKRIDNSTKDLKLRFSEITANTKESQDIQAKFIKVCDLQSDSLQLLHQYLQKNKAYKNAVDATNTPVLAGVSFRWNPIHHQYEENYREWQVAGTQEEVDEARKQKNTVNMRLMQKVKELDFSRAVLQEALSPDITVGANRAVSLLDLQILNIPELVLVKQISVVNAEQLLGKRVSIKFDNNEDWSGAIAKFENGEIWIEHVTDASMKGKIARVLISKPGIASQRGVKIGDNVQEVTSKYGEPNRKTENKNKQYTTVTQWYYYFLKDQGNMRVVFGIDSGGNVSYIGYSQTPGGI